MLGAAKNFIRQTKPLYRAVNRLRGMRIHSASITRDFEILGSDYGGWAINRKLLDESSIVYSFGIGEDITFDLALIDAVGCRVYCFDPSPIAVDWIAGQDLPAAFVFDPTGLSDEDGEIEFHIPPVDGWHSFSMTPEPGAAQVGMVQCPVRRLSTIMARYGHNHIDLLKMDIEGFEYPALDDMMQEAIKPRTLLIEFHHGNYGIKNEKTLRAVENLKRYGYEPFWVSDVGKEYAFEAVR